MSRRWFSHRQAYSPRPWPTFLVAIVVAMAATQLSGAGPVGGVLVGGACGVVIVHARWWLWRHRHPTLSPQVWLERQREAAPWN